MGEGKSETVREFVANATVSRIHEHVRAEIRLNRVLQDALQAERAVAQVALDLLRDLRALLEEKQHEIDGLQDIIHSPQCPEDCCS